MRIITTYLEQSSPEDIRPAGEPAIPIDIRRVEQPAPEFSRFLYTAVGGDWYWVSRLPWTWQDWYDQLSRPGVETWVGWVRGVPVGYAELVAWEGNELTGEGRTDVEIDSFGLLPAYIGQGLGGHLLTECLRRAWSLGERWPSLPPVYRVWLHTCTLDGPHALNNYLARGLRPYLEQQSEQRLPDEPPGPWPDADRPPPPS